MIRFLCFGDLHLGPTDPQYDWERPVCETDPDLIVSIGDIIDDNIDHASDATTGSKYETRGRKFYEHLNNAFECPVLAVPGNHDPVDCTNRLAEGLDSVIPLHQRSLTTSEVGVDVDQRYAFIGWGAEQFDLTPVFNYLDYPSVDPEVQAEDKSYAKAARECATRVEETVAKYLVGACTATEAASELGIERDEVPRFVEELSGLEDRYRRLRSLLQENSATPLLFAHKTPFNVSFDVPRGNDALHVGSLPVKLATVATKLPLVVCGHYHTTGFDVITDGHGHTYVSNHGSPGVATIEFEPEASPRVIHWDNS